LRGLKGDAHGAKIMVHDPQRTGARPSGQARTPSADAPPDASGDRVAKMLARAGVASRREVERLIEAGRVALNGKVLTTPAVKVEAGDILTVDGAVVTEAEPARVFRYHKPLDLVTSHKDPQGRPTVFDHLPGGLPRLISVGRLDINSEGLLLLTNDGGLARALEMPATGIVRRYRARARGRVTQEKLDTLKKGITVEGVHYGAIEATLDKAKEGPQGANLWITVVLAEGKNREVRRVLEALGLKVNRLIRLSYGPFALGTLMPGEVEEVGPRVIREQMADHIAPQNLPKGDRPLWKAPAKVAAGPRRGATEIGRPGAKPTRPGKGHGRPRGTSPTGEAPKKMEYKAGWAKPKPKPVIAKTGSPKRKSGGNPGGGGTKRR
jgi:23S rRNA pseudouridine2605 synthase